MSSQCVAADRSIAVHRAEVYADFLDGGRLPDQIS
jgi:hypothetical protein